MSSYFPIFVDVRQFKIVFIGGGRVAERRVRVLHQFGARITLIAPEATEALQRLAEFGQIEWVQRPYQEGDFSDPSIGLAIIATDDRQVNHQAGQEALREAVPASVADSRAESTFYFPGVAKKDNIVAGITASGLNHKQAAQITRQIQEFLEEI